MYRTVKIVHPLVLSLVVDPVAFTKARKGDEKVAGGQTARTLYPAPDEALSRGDNERAGGPLIVLGDHTTSSLFPFLFFP
jgi:hypothetical protein